MLLTMISSPNVFREIAILSPLLDVSGIYANWRGATTDYSGVAEPLNPMK
jgi:hypothetical protein